MPITLNMFTENPVFTTWAPTMLLVIAMFIILCIVISLLTGIPKQEQYKKRASLFTKSELQFYKILINSIPPGTCLYGKVRMADVLTPTTSRAHRKQWQIAFNKIQSKHFDYVLCDSNTLSFVAVIELDDKGHNQPNRKANDILKNKACAGSGLPLIRFPMQRNYNAASIKHTIIKTL